ncbi:hypothetical protein ACFYRN_40410 [Streptomyces sp. NPDC005227]|uniref:hypothetical protein n=1 Tax=Streptomyces sp. NPDC005227 TaxID=3364707 RepID=UPI003674D870
MTLTGPQSSHRSLLAPPLTTGRRAGDHHRGGEEGWGLVTGQPHRLVSVTTRAPAGARYAAPRTSLSVDR